MKHEFDHGTIYQGDCLEVMKGIPDNSVDLILADLPYGTTDCKWDSIIPLQPLWEQYKRILQIRGVVVLTGIQPFTSMLIMSNIKNYRHKWVWEKDKCANFQLVKSQPQKHTEDVCVFSFVGFQKAWNDKQKIKSTYNPQMRDGHGGRPNKRLGTWKNKGNFIKQLNNRNAYRSNHHFYVNDSSQQRYPTDIIYFPVPLKNNRIHPTQKPVALFEYLIRTYSNEGDMILDNVIGSGTTAVAAYQIGRTWIGIEKDADNYKMAIERINRDTAQRLLFSS